MSEQLIAHRHNRINLILFKRGSKEMRFQQHLCHCKNLKWQAIRLACKLVEERAHERMKAVYPKTARDCVVHGNSIVRCCVIDKVYPSDELFWRLRPRLQRGDQLIPLTRGSC